MTSEESHQGHCEYLQCNEKIILIKYLLLFKDLLALESSVYFILHFYTLNINVKRKKKKRLSDERINQQRFVIKNLFIK